MPSTGEDDLSGGQDAGLQSPADERSGDSANYQSGVNAAGLIAIYILIVPIFFLVGLGTEAAKSWTRESEERRIRRSERLVRGMVSDILSAPEFSNSVKVDGSQAFVVEFLKEHEADVTQDFVRWNERLRDRVQAGAAVIVATVVYFSVAAEQLPKKWKENDAKSLSEFPSTGWVQGLLDPLGREGAVALGIVLVSVIAIAAYSIYVEFRSQYRIRAEMRKDAEEALLPQVRVALNEWSEEKSPIDLMFDEAPALSSAADMLYVIDRVEVDRIATLIHELGASAVAISGPRGAGKSTLLRSIATSQQLRSSLCVSLEAPASYESREFILTLYRQLCQYIVARVSTMIESRLRRAARVILTCLRVLVVFSGVVIASAYWAMSTGALQGAGRYGLMLQNAWQVGSYMALLLVIYYLLGVFRPYRRIPGAIDVVERAAESEEGLRFLQNISVERSGGVKVKLGLELGRKRTRQLLEQPATLPDIVRSYRLFVSDTLQWWRRYWPSGNLVVIIDELDRVTDVESAERFINDIKGIFGIRHCTYLVTVSEDALSQFERRMVGIRPVLDSTFDEVVRLPVLNFNQAKDMLARRLVGFPHAFMALCHSLSGGIPRDLIRTARALIDLRRASGRNDLAFLAHELVQQEVRRLKSGLIGRVNSDLVGVESFRLLKLLADPDWPESNAEFIIAASRELVAQGEASDGYRVSAELGVALFYYGTVLQVFTDFWLAPSRGADRLAESAQALAVARSVMPASVELAFVHLERLREKEMLFRNAVA
ncbi:ATP-binding protein [Micromonospora rifamycinica]|uniref:ATP-binding protein n=1 Tax=Micromonospora rifamycinica TaxID=291594 RepID=UPI0033C142EA